MLGLHEDLGRGAGGGQPGTEWRRGRWRRREGQTRSTCGKLVPKPLDTWVRRVKRRWGEKIGKAEHLGGHS